MLLKSLIINKASSINTLVYQYDTDNNKILETELDPSGKKLKVTVYKYNQGLRTEKTVYNGSNQITSKKTYKYVTH